MSAIQTFRLTSLAALREAGFDTIIDVRSPAEYAEDHVPGAIGLPALSDAERAEVGTIYVQDSRFRARKIGAAMVARNVAAHLEGPLAGMAGGWRPLVYCWRGGQRSGSVATILAQIGWRVSVLEGGYRTYRRLVAEMLHDRPLPHRFVLLDGNTGTAKTALLHRLAAAGWQTVDLEGLAHHRGSLFGGRPGGQPSQKAFEGALAAALDPLDPGRPVVVEAESNKIGQCLIPPSLWSAMLTAPRVEVTAPLAARAEYLARAYADLCTDAEVLDGVLERLVPYQGRKAVDDWRAMAAEGAFVPLAAALMEHHYDPRYAKSRRRGAERIAGTVAFDALDEAALDAGTGELSVALDATLGAGATAAG